jgi:hypothetical protein
MRRERQKRAGCSALPEPATVGNSTLIDEGRVAGSSPAEGSRETAAYGGFRSLNAASFPGAHRPL